METSRSLRSGFLASVNRFPDRPALALGERSWSYSELYELAAGIAASIDAVSKGDAVPLTGVFGHRSVEAFAGVLAALFRGHGYVPLNPSFPVDRTISMIDRSRLDWIVVESGSLETFTKILDGLERPIGIVVAELESAADIAARYPKHTFISGKDILTASEWRPAPVEPNGLAYLLFTSGSTGVPKGVMVAHRNVTHFIDVMTERYEITTGDRFSQTFDLTFDLSVFDMFVAWERGACVCCPTQQEKLFPSKYIDNHEISIWFSVPSTAAMMKKLRMLKPARYPTIRFSLFCGEALPLDLAEAFQSAAPNSLLENLYGPTELTIACTSYTYSRELARDESAYGLTPIGEPYPGMCCLIVDESLIPVEYGCVGELLMTGPQLTLGYWEDEARTDSAFVVPPNSAMSYYRTGDRVIQNGADSPLLYIGRTDNQIKLQGYRVELGEIEAAIREETRGEIAIVVGYPEGESGFEGVIGFVSVPGIDADHLRKLICAKLPSYMHPARIVNVEEFPLNANGKVDRKALLESV